MSALTLFRIGGTEYRLDVTFALLFGWIVITAFLFGGLASAIANVTFVAIVFGSVLAHELGHLAVARMFGIPTLNVTLTLFGGYAEFARKPQTWTEENLVAFAGPAVNLGIAALLLIVMGEFNLDTIWARLQGWRPNLVDDIVYVNLLLGLFNLLPGLPMDGGRIVRGLLAPSAGLRFATLVPAWIGVAIGLGVALNALLDRDTFVAIIGIYMAFAAWSWVNWGRGVARRQGGSPRP